MSGSEYLLWSYGQFEKMTFFPPDPLSTQLSGNIVCPRTVDTQSKFVRMSLTKYSIYNLDVTLCVNRRVDNTPPLHK
jgi:hypothetical protein